VNDNYKFEIKRKRPEDKYSDVIGYYDEENIEKYANSKSLMRIQENMTIRAIELLNLPVNDSLILDLGSGVGFAGMYLTEVGYKVIALDIISEFLRYYDIKELNPIIADMCLIPFKPKTFDAIVSISALQWIYRDIQNKNNSLALKNLAKSVYSILKPNTKAIFQFYPKSDMIMNFIGKIFVDNTPFKGGFMIDNPNSPKKRKIYLILNKV
jgi:18S rRNA (guanine1575-N7)-methyltransferase